MAITAFLSMLCAGNIFLAPSCGFSDNLFLARQAKSSMARLPSHTSLPLLTELTVSATCDWKLLWCIHSLSLCRSSRSQNCYGIPEDPGVAAPEGRGLKHL